MKQYEKKEVNAFVEMLAMVVVSLSDKPSDFLGSAFMRHELNNHWTGQYFSPFPLCEAMASMTLHNAKGMLSNEKPFLTLLEPAAGSGAMAVAAAVEFTKQGLDYTQQLHVTCVDLAPVCVHMATVQLSVLGVPACIYRGNSLSMEIDEVFVTNNHWLGRWTEKLNSDPEVPTEQVKQVVVDAAKQMTLF